jgi:hypothetical protein
LVLPLLLGAVVIAITYVVVTDTRFPVAIGPRTDLIALLVVGFAMCTLGGSGQVAASGRWLAAPAIVGSVLGVAILVIVVAGLVGWKLPLMSTPNDAVLAVAAIIGVKTVIGTLGYFFHFL